MMTLNPNNAMVVIGRKTGADKINIGKAVLNEEPVKEFIERMKAQGYDINTTENGVEITGDNLDVNALSDELKKLARPLSEAEWLKICEEHGINPGIRRDTV